MYGLKKTFFCIILRILFKNQFFKTDYHQLTWNEFRVRDPNNPASWQTEVVVEEAEVMVIYWQSKIRIRISAWIRGQHTVWPDVWMLLEMSRWILKLKKSFISCFQT
jgi:hypothetical protein